MLSRRALALAALVVAVSAPALATPAPPARDHNFTIRNNSGYAVSGLYVSGCEVIDWQPLPLSPRAFPDGVLYPGQNVVYPFNPGCVNLLLLTPEGHEFHYGGEVTAYDTYEWVLSNDQLAAAGYDAGPTYDVGYGYIEVANDNGYDDVKDVLFRVCGTEWDSDYLVEGERIPLAQAQSFELPAGCWDAAVRLTSGQVVNWTDLNVQPDQSLRLRVPPAH